MVNRGLVSGITCLALLLAVGCARPRPAPPPPSQTQAPAPMPVSVQPEPESRLEVFLLHSFEGKRELRSGDRLPYRPPVRLQFRIQGDPSGDQLEQALKSALSGVTATLRRLDATAVEVTLDAPPPELRVDVPGLAEPLVLKGEPPPSLVLVNPADGQETFVAPAPTDVAEGSLSPDGRWLVLVTHEHEGIRMMLADLKTGTRKPLPMRIPPFTGMIIWRSGKLAVPAGDLVQTWDLERGALTEHKSAGRLWRAVSPDGRYLAGFHWEGVVVAGSLSPATIVVHDTETGTERIFPKVGTAYIGSHHAEFGIAWAPDGNLLLQEVLTVSPKTERTLSLDLSTGKTTVVDRPFPEPGANMPGKNGWRLKSTYWGKVEAISPQSKEVSLGEGLPLGWAPDGRLLVLRWGSYQQRIVIGI